MSAAPATPLRLFVSGTGTDVGKTWVTCAIARALQARGEPVLALKPIETGADPVAVDAASLAEAAGHAPVHDGLYRAAAPLAPLSVALAGGPTCDVESIARATTKRLTLARGHVLVEGAGGLLVPLTDACTIDDLARRLELPLLLVARDRLGVLHDARAAVRAAGPERVVAVVLNRFGAEEASWATNLEALRATLDVPVLLASGDRDEAGRTLSRALLERPEPKPERLEPKRSSE